MAAWIGQAGLGLVMVTGSAQASERLLDDMDDARGWTLQVAEPGQARLLAVAGARGGRALCVDFDFGPLPGKASLTRALALPLPAQGRFQLQWRGQAAQASVQLQGLDSRGELRWSAARSGSEMGRDWQWLRLPVDGVQAGASVPLAALRWTISSPGGGAGQVCLDQLQLRTGAADPAPLSATALADTATALQQRMVDGRRDTLWVSSGVKQQTVSLDLGRVRELGGLQVDWAAGLRATDYRVQVSADGRRWQPLREVRAASGTTDRLRFGSIDARYLRLDLRDGPNWRYGIVDVLPQPASWGSSMAAFMTQVGSQLPAGSLPASLGEEPLPWVVIGAAGASAPAWMAADGSLETWPGQFSVQPWVQVDGTWLGARDVQARALPAPAGQARAGWEHAQLQLEVLAHSWHTDRNGPWLRTRYRLRNPDKQAHRYALALALRPFQLNPAQRLGDLPGGVGRLEQLRIEGAQARVNGRLVLKADSAPALGFASHFDAGLEVSHLRAATVPVQATADDVQGLASGAMVWRWQLDAGQQRELDVWLPMSSVGVFDQPPAAGDVPAAVAGDVVLALPGHDGAALVGAWQAAQARIAAERAGPWLRVDSRRQLGSSDGQAVQRARALYLGGAWEAVAEWLLASAPALAPEDCMGWSHWLELAAGLQRLQAFTPAQAAPVQGYASLADAPFQPAGACSNALAQPRVRAAERDLQQLLPDKPVPPLAAPTTADPAALSGTGDAAAGEPAVVVARADAGVAALPVVEPLTQAERAQRLQQAIARIGNSPLPAGWQQWRASGETGLVDASQAASKVLAIAGLLVEVQADYLRLAPAVPVQWLAEGVQVTGLPTPWGRLGYHWRAEKDAWLITFAPGLQLPPGGLLIDWPLPGEPGATTADGAPLQWQQGQLRLTQLPAQLRIGLPAGSTR